MFKPAPVIAAASPFLRSRAVSLRGQAIVEKETRIAFQSGQVILVREDEGGPHKAPDQ